MKKIVFVRHAKSDHHFGLEDIDRPLSPQGKRDAATMAGVLKTRGVVPQRIISSGSLRTLTTVQIFIKELDIFDCLVVDNRLYMGDSSKYLSVIHEIDNDCDTVAIVGHNPVISEVCELLSGASVGTLSPCAICAITFAANGFDLITPSSGSLEFFDSPNAFRRPT
ncbi:phosphoglycerate mutase [Campylobacterota bacterium]|nr:phosphoglycerate mutase [Campylobacterota bacterium]